MRTGWSTGRGTEKLVGKSRSSSLWGRGARDLSGGLGGRWSAEIGGEETLCWSLLKRKRKTLRERNQEQGRGDRTGLRYTLTTWTRFRNNVEVLGEPSVKAKARC